MLALNNRIVVKQISTDKTKGGIVIPDKYRPNAIACVVISVGKECKDQSLPGKRIVTMPSWGIRVNINDEEHIVLREDEALGVLETSEELSIVQPC